MRKCLCRAPHALAFGIVAAVALFCFAPSRVSAQQIVIADPDFQRLGFDRWVAEGPRTDIPWKLDVNTFGLTFFQRFLASVDIHVAGDAVFARAGKGQLLFFAQFTDSRGFVFQSHNHVNLSDVEDDRHEVMFSQNILVIPGDYRVDFAVYDSATEERSFAQRTFHIAPLHNDPLPNLWDGADSVEIVPDLGAPAKWFLPRATDKLHLPVDAQTPVNLQIIASGGWSDELTLEKVLSQIDVTRGSSDLAVLSYQRRAVVFEQNLAQPLDWEKLKTALASVDPNTIDAKALGDRRENLNFFLDELERRIASGPAASPAAESALPVYIIVSPPWDFRSADKVDPIRVPEGGQYLVFYVRCSVEDAKDLRARTAANLNHPRVGGAASLERQLPDPDFQKSGGMDYLEHTLAPLHPRLLDISSARGFSQSSRYNTSRHRKEDRYLERLEMTCKTVTVAAALFAFAALAAAQHAPRSQMVLRRTSLRFRRSAITGSFSKMISSAPTKWNSTRTNPA